MFKPEIESEVKVDAKAAAFSASPIPWVAVSTSLIISVISRKLPFASITATVVSPMAIFPSSIFAVMSRIIAETLVPASELFDP